MSSAKQCDRCGGLYIPIPTVPKPEWSKDWWRYDIIKDCHPYPEEKLDLSPECKSKLADWLRGNDK